jgi:dTDP-4-amino-4,6-dideoxygalactose transaminase
VSRHPGRDELRAYLDEQGVQTLIHYPIPPHHQEAYADWKEKDLPITEQIHEEVFSLPMGPHLTDAEVNEVIKAVNSYPAAE